MAAPLSVLLALLACGERLPDGTGSPCVASYAPEFDEGALLGDGSLPPCEGETAETCQVRSLDVSGASRCYVMNMPAAPTEGLPLVVVWHGSSSNGETARRALNTEFEGLALEAAIDNEALVVYPDGRTHRDCKRSTCWDRDPEGPDVVFFDALVEQLEADWQIDTTQVFSVGHSRGGRFVEVLGCYRSEQLAGAAMIAAGRRNVDSCPGSLPIWLSHGVDDAWVSFSHGVEHLENWAERNQCDPVDVDAYPHDTCTLIPGCEHAVEWCPTTGGDWEGHAPPTLADEELWRFFKAQLP